jgi:putative acetyltransferase
MPSWSCVDAAVTIRPARTGDEEMILSVVGAAFSDETRDAGEERAIVRRTWEQRPTRHVVELVADEGGVVVGHLQAAPGRLDGAESPVAGVAPVCVAPAAQGRGVGSALVRALVRETETLGWPLLVVLGEPAYYGRFGFEPAGRYGLEYAPAGPANPHFQARPIGGADVTGLSGEFCYCWE